MKTITIFTDAWDPQINGVVTTLKTTKEHLERRGYAVKVIHPELYKLTVPLQPSTGIYMPIFPAGVVKNALMNADHIHIATEGSIGLAARYFCQRYNKKYTSSFHTKYPEYLYEHVGIPPRLTAQYFSWFHRNSNSILVPTPSMVDYCRELGILNTVLWSRGVDTSIFKPTSKVSSSKIRAVYVGRISAEKNIEAFLSINDSDIQKTLIGDGPQLVDYKNRYPDAVFLGRMTKEQIAEELPKHDVFAWPSLTDTFGLVVLEGMASGLPVAAFDNDVNRHIIEHGKSGCLVDNDLAAAIHYAVELDPAKAVARARTFSWEAATDQFESYLV